MLYGTKDNKSRGGKGGRIITVFAEVRQEDPVLGPCDLALSLRDGVEPLGVAQLGGRDDEVPHLSADLELIGLQRNSR